MDIDGDGHLDIISGSYSRKDNNMAGLFQVLYGNKDGTFRIAEVLIGSDGNPLIISPKMANQLPQKICTRPFAVDWDSDGKLDLIVGNMAGTFYWFKGEGKGKFTPTVEQLMVGDKPQKLPKGHGDPFVVDWDGDGALDLLSGCADGGVYLAKNQAGKGKVPVLLPFEPLINPKPRKGEDEVLRDGDLTGPSSNSRIWVADSNGDGKLDILVGDSVTLASPAKGLTDADFKKKYAEWNEKLQKANKAWQKATDQKDREKASEEISKLYNSRDEFINEEMTGFVWLFLQK